MTSHNQPASGTEGSVPGATRAPHASTLAAFQTLLSAMASLNQANAEAAASAASAPSAGLSTTAGPATASTVPPPPPPPAPAAPAAPTGFRNHGPWVADALYLVVPAQHLQAVPEAFSFEVVLWYCITRGKWVGVTRSNSLALGAVVGVSGSHMKSYKTQALALAAFNQSLNFRDVAILD
ncbi:hypothetical protein R3P38DRAFT_3199259 [Favolaschia claudopus]|uniref:Uncharacterized protein n=1 Tax=Favolaschia claudopus TaxID=2862362 RepID=A0AAW0B0Y8_9AGAR